MNELTRLILRGMEDLQTKEPPVSFRYHDNIDEETFRLAIKVALEGGSHPAFFDDNNAIPALMALGFTLEQARDWCLLGCTVPIVPGISDYQSMLGFFNTIKVFEVTLYGGKDPVTGKQIGPVTSEAKDFEYIGNAFAVEDGYVGFSDAYSLNGEVVYKYTIERYGNGGGANSISPEVLAKLEGLIAEANGYGGIDAFNEADNADIISDSDLADAPSLEKFAAVEDAMG